MTLYFRDQGPLCYELPVFYTGPDLRTSLVEELLATELKWFWESEGRDVTGEIDEQRRGPRRRPLAELTTTNSPELLRDLLERDIDGYGRMLVLIGIDSREAEKALTEDSRRTILELFSAREAGPARIILIQLGDQPNEQVFVPRNPIPCVRLLLEGWGVRPETINKKRRYRGLNLASLENVLALPGAYRPWWEKLRIPG